MARRRSWTGLLVLAVAGSAPGLANAGAPTPTYHKEVVRVLQKQCQDCHRPGEVAPFPLLTYTQARKHAADIVQVTGTRRMPPWPASTTEGGPFKDARVLSDEDVKTVASWLDAGCPEGDPHDAPPERAWASDWPLGKPDLELSIPRPYALNADGRDEHRVFVIPTNLKEGVWLSAIDIKPGNAKVVHHVLVAFDTLNRARKLDEKDPEPGYPVFGGFGIVPSGNVGGWAPGKRPRTLPEGIGRYLPAACDLLMQVHYHKSGKPETDATRVALYFSKARVDKEMLGGMVLPPRGELFRPSLRIPAGDAHYEVKGSMVLREDSHINGVTPHMHWLGHDFLLSATRPDGSKVTLIKIDDWDFNWQGAYDFVTPVALPKGTKVDMLAHFDNSATNPFNPNQPPKDVTWGEQTTDEMCIGFLQRTMDAQHLDGKIPARFQQGNAPGLFGLIQP